ncbi:MAG TPA: xanthine dehydrogenase family protein molybdopterin-binding subunit, partial [Dehalococcoidia bacterium]|nr:xanthine dehydrogenase family protein molybdopterin-binding subunit [Dehalococcoidia bacterium]
MAQETMARPESESAQHRFVGKPLSRPDATAKVTGKTVYADDMHLPRMLHAKVLGAPYAHAQIKAIDTSKARTHPGVAAVITADDLPQYKMNASNRRGLIFPKDEVLFHG